MERWRDRKFRLLLYPDDPTHVKAMQVLDESGYKYAAILHDKDVYSADDPDDDDSAPGEIGSLKKPHWHVVVKFLNPVWSTSLAKNLGIADNYVKDCKNIDGALLYLVHANRPEKYQYDLDAVFGDLHLALTKLLVDDDEGSRVLTIIGMIDDMPGCCTYRQVLIKVCNAGLYGDFRRLGSGAKTLIDEHNAAYLDEFHSRSSAGAFSNAIDRDGFAHFIAGYESCKKENNGGLV